MEKLGKITLYNADCMEIMKGFADKQFDLAIVDPPYGLGKRLANGSKKIAYLNLQKNFVQKIGTTKYLQKNILMN